VDLALVAGGISFLVLPLVFLVSPATGAFAFMALSLVANYPHYMATDYRVYGTRAQLHRYKFFAIYVTGLLLATAVLSHLFVGPWVNVIVTIYAIWTPYHYVGQNYGIAVMYAGRGGVRVTPGEKWLLYSAFIASMFTYLLLLAVRPPGSGPTLAQLNIPPDAVRTAHIVLMIAGITAATILTWRLTRRASLRVLTPILMVMAVHFVWFTTPGALILFHRQLSVTGLDTSLFVPALAFLHSAQYLGVTTYYTKREQAQQHRQFRLGPYLVLLLVGGVLLWPVMIRVFSQVFVVDYAVSVMLLNALINIHHFILDGAIWKLRDGRLARLLISNDAFPAGRETPAASAIGDMGAPAGGESRLRAWLGANRGLAWAMVVSLALLIHGADSLRVFMMLKAVTLRQAQRWQDANRFYRSALTLNSHVADADEGLAVVDMVAGNMQSAAEHWARSVRLNPISAHLRAGLGETYLNLGRVDDAIVQLEEAVRLAPEDTTGIQLLARARSAKGDQDGARALMDRARAVNAEARRRALAL
jgi:tetratricopeptide (TPR) repeat protein